MKLGIILAAGALVVGTCAFAQFTFGGSNATGATATGGSSLTNVVYNPSSYAWAVGTPGGTEGFTVTADVEMWMSMAFNANEINFHIGGDLGEAPSLSQNVTGWVNTNNGQYIFITKRDGDPSAYNLTHLKFVKDVLNRTDTAHSGTDIPVAWTAYDSKHPAGIVLEYSDQGNAGQEKGMMWLLNDGATGNQAFTVKCTISPERYQADGHYEMDPIVVASPEL